MISLPPLKFQNDDFEATTPVKRTSSKYVKHPVDCILVTDSIAARSSSDTLNRSSQAGASIASVSSTGETAESVESYLRSRNAFDYYASSNHSASTSPGSVRQSEQSSVLPRGSISNQQSAKTLQLVSSFLQCLDDDINMCSESVATEHATTDELEGDLYPLEDWETEDPLNTRMCISCPEAATVDFQRPSDTARHVRSLSSMHLHSELSPVSQSPTRSSSPVPTYSRLFGTPDRKLPAIASCPTSPFPARVSRRVDSRPSTRRARHSFFESPTDESTSAATTSESAASLPRLAKIGGLATGPGIGIASGKSRRPRRVCRSCSLDGLKYHPSCPVMNSAAEEEDEEVLVVQDL